MGKLIISKELTNAIYTGGKTLIPPQIYNTIMKTAEANMKLRKAWLEMCKEEEKPVYIHEELKSEI